VVPTWASAPEPTGHVIEFSLTKEVHLR